MITDFNKEKGRAVAEDIASTGARTLFVKGDISNSEDVQSMVARTA